MQGLCQLTDKYCSNVNCNKFVGKYDFEPKYRVYCFDCNLLILRSMAMAAVDKNVEEGLEAAVKVSIDPAQFEEALASSSGFKLTNTAKELGISAADLKNIIVGHYGIDNLEFRKGRNGGVFLIKR